MFTQLKVWQFINFYLIKKKIFMETFAWSEGLGSSQSATEVAVPKQINLQIQGSSNLSCR